MQPLAHWLARQRRKNLLVVILTTLAMLALLASMFVRFIQHTPIRHAGPIIAVNDDLSLMMQTDPAHPPVRITLAGLRWPDDWRVHARPALEQLALHQPAYAVAADYAPPAMLVYLDSGELLNETLCDRGLAQCDPADTALLHPWLARVHRWAKSAKRGLWASPPDHIAPPVAPLN